ncbi:cytochrome c [Solimonas terrae]|uniref:Cytochrome c n=1 Tax=Solimonas terrae TaxID=1396819 RepID=A0A6M2BPV2_9GAMM|nr:cytochrome c [Solimonas terrae]
MLLLALCACQARQADEAPPARAAACGACHPRHGEMMAPLFPLLAGQNAPYLTAQLRAFRDGSRRNPVMNAMARNLDDDEIDALSRYYASLGDGAGVGRGSR